VDTDAARGGDVLRALSIKFGLDPQTGAFYPTTKKHVLLFGPIGGGKSTELRRFAMSLKESRKFFPILVNVRGEIDINNLRYSDVLMALANAVVRELHTSQISLDKNALEKMQAWFTECVLTTDKTIEIAGNLTAEAEAGLKVPLLASLMAKFTSTFKNASAYKEAVREVVQKSFTQFAAAFNELMRAAEQQVCERKLGERILLLVDGTDKAAVEDARALFVSDAEQLLAIEALVLYTAPISLKYGGTTHGKLDSDLVLPIIKLCDRDGARCDAGWKAMRSILGRRIDLTVFTGDDAIDLLISQSGGHPREMLRLLQMACEFTNTASITPDIVKKAVAKLASDYRFWLQPEDYAVLAAIDHANGANIGNDERTRNLLWRSALLHYNDGSWRATHPALRDLEGYVSARKALTQAKAAGATSPPVT
jgi:hypothetical protein